MTSKERVRLTIEHKPVDRLALDFHARDEVYADLQKRLGVNTSEAVERALGSDLRRVRPIHPGEVSKIRYADPTVRITPDGLYHDIWGVGFRVSDSGHGAYTDLEYYPLKSADTLDDIIKHHFPSPDDLDYSTIIDQVRKHSDKWVWFNARGVFEVSWFMRGFEEFLMDLAAEPEKACFLMDTVLAYQKERARRILKAGQGLIDMVEYNDDMGTQQSLFMSTEMWRTFIKPRMADFIHTCKSEFGVKVRYHSCGAIQPIIGDLIDIGIDMLNPIQTLAAGMEPEELQRQFGGRIVFNGGIDTQEVLPRATPAEVAQETRRIIRILGKRGGLVLGPSHRFQGDVPVENILAMYNTALVPHGSSQSTLSRNLEAQ
jgi:uroporphyrinogen decarboxylase